MKNGHCPPESDIRSWAVDRTVILWFGLPPPKAVAIEFEQRNFSIQTDLKQFSHIAKGCVFRFNAPKPGQLKNHFQDTAPILSDLGVECFLWAGDIKSIPIIEAIKKSLKGKIVPPYLESIPLLSPAPHVLPEKIARLPPAPIARTTPLNFRGDRIPKRAQNLLHRAFYDCSELTLIKLTGGYTDAIVLCVHALLEAGTRPLPFFAKIDKRKRIGDELKNYTEYVENFVPFNLRPNIDRARCCLGCDLGILVGSFVSHSESLMDVASRGHAQLPLYSLFDNALKGWRMQAISSHTATDSMVNTIFPYPRPLEYRFQKELKEQIKGAGARTQPNVLRRLIIQKSTVPQKIGTIHGDLHATNILVRNHDAILIDFFSTRKGPIAADAASLEISLVFSEEAIVNDIRKWRLMVDKLYSKIDGALLPPERPSRREWVWTVVRQIRMHNLSGIVSDLEYKIALAIFLFRYASFYNSKSSENMKTAFTYAYLMAEKIILDMLPA